MRIQYADAGSTAILATLDEGETLGHQRGPASFTVPVAPGNVDFDAIALSDIAIEAYAAPLAVPQSVTNYQARTVLIQRGLIAKVDGALRGADMSQPANQIALAAWDYANSFERSSPLIGAMAQLLGLSSNDVDALFVAAAAVS